MVDGFQPAMFDDHGLSDPQPILSLAQVWSILSLMSWSPTIPQEPRAGKRIKGDETWDMAGKQWIEMVILWDMKRSWFVSQQV